MRHGRKLQILKVARVIVPAHSKLHYQMNLFLSRLDEQQRRWYVALEAKKMGMVVLNACLKSQG